MSHFKRVEDGIFIDPQPTGQDLQDAKGSGPSSIFGCHPRRRHPTRH